MKRMIGLLILGFLFYYQQAVFAEESRGNCVIAAGDMWGTYTPANFRHEWPRMNYTDALAERGGLGSISGGGNFLFVTTRLVSSAYFGNPGYGWPFGRYTFDFTNYLGAIEFNPSEEFAVLNEPIHGSVNRNYALLHYNTQIPGTGDPDRDYRNPDEKGCYLNDARNYAWYEASWPTQLGVDVKMKVHSWTFPFGNLDDFHLIEFEFYNTGQADVNGDGTVDLTNNRINALVLPYGSGSFAFKINEDGSRTYANPSFRFRGMGYDATPDANGASWDFSFQAIGSNLEQPQLDYPGLGYDGWYHDIYGAYTFLGAKAVDENGNITGDKNLCFQNAEGEKVVPAVGSGVQRGWFRTNQSTDREGMIHELSEYHHYAMGSFFESAGKAGTVNDLAPNLNIFGSGTEGDPTTFVTKDPAEWTCPDGAYEKAEPVMITDPQTGTELGLNPIEPETGEPLEPGIITEGFIAGHEFNGDYFTCIGPFSLEVGERMRVYFMRGAGFRISGARAAVKAARTVYASMDATGHFQVPMAPPAPDMKIETSVNMTPQIKWQEISGVSGYKIYRASASHKYWPLDEGTCTAATYWKNMDATTVPAMDPINPLFGRPEMVDSTAGEHWGPFRLVQVVEAAELGNYQNPDTDNVEYAFIWEDTSPELMRGDTLFYYVAAYEVNPTIPAAFADLEDPAITWLESGKVNLNGRSGYWENTWPWTTAHTYYPTDAGKLKDLGAAFVLGAKTSVNPAKTTVPSDDFNLAQNYPNPFNPVTYIRFQLPQPERVRIAVYNMLGQEIKLLVAERKPAGSFTAKWDATDRQSRPVPNGLYLCQMRAGGFVQTVKMVLMK